MKNYDQEYYFIVKDADNERLPFLTPDINTAERRYAENPPAPGSPPLIFSNGWKDQFATANVRDEVADVLFEGTNFLVCSHIRDRLLPLELPNVVMHPAIYIDDRGNWHEDFWFVGITSEFDCWDRTRSKCGAKTVSVGDETLYSVFTYSLDSKMLERTPLEQRLIFQMGATVDGLVTCHESIAGIFRLSRTSGALIQPITDY